jgi:glycosyltransferase involved in cell wall biosynthesis
VPEQRYRVLVIASHPVQYSSPILQRMAQHPQIDLQVAYCTLRGAEPAVDPDFGAVVQWDVPLLEGYPWQEIPNKGSGGPGFFGLYNPGLWKLIRSGHFDAVICYTGYLRSSFWIALVAARLSGSAMIFGTDASSLAPRDARVSWKIALKKLVWPLLFRLADQVIVPSSAGQDLMRSLGIPAERITLTPYPVDNDWWTRQSQLVDRNAIRSAWGASPGTTVILFCAKLQPWKRPLDLLRAFAQAHLNDALLVFAGDGSLREQLQAEAKTLGVADRVRLLGFMNQSQLPPVYTSADLMVLPSEYEPFAVVVNEAACCGCPTAASDRVGAARDLIAPVNPSLVFPCANVPALTDVLRNAASNPQKLREAGAAARRRMDTWSPQENISATVEAIQLAVSRKRHTPVAENSSRQPEGASGSVPRRLP